MLIFRDDHDAQLHRIQSEPSMQDQLTTLIVRHGLPKVMKCLADITKNKGGIGLSRPGIERTWAAMLSIKGNIYNEHLKSLNKP